MPSQIEQNEKKGQISSGESTSTCNLNLAKRLLPGMPCPRCGKGIVDYDGLLQLVCPVCGLKETGAVT
jgi:predicted RNA-binding Zn-ribbon protein involved in translation (DUF1610 family)